MGHAPPNTSYFMFKVMQVKYTLKSRVGRDKDSAIFSSLWIKVTKMSDRSGVEEFDDPFPGNRA